MKVMLHKKLIDQETLSRLIEECREEEDRYSIMHGDDDYSNADEQRIMLHSSNLKERSKRDLAKLEDQSKLLKEADEVQKDLENIKDRYMTVLDSVNEREKSILMIEEKMK